MAMIRIPFKLLDQRSFDMEVPSNYTIGQVKAAIKARYNVAETAQTMIFAGKILQNDATVEGLGIARQTAVMISITGVIDLTRPNPATIAGGAAPPAAGPAAAAPAAVPAAAAAPVAVPVAAVVPAAPAADERKAAEAGMPPPVVAGPPVAVYGGFVPAREVPAAGGGVAPAVPAAGAAGAGAGTGMLLHVRQLNGGMLAINVDIGATFERIKGLIATETGIPIVQQRLVYRGQLIDDNLTPRDYHMDKDTCLHLVRKVQRANMDEAIPIKIQANCIACHIAGAEFQPRPLCRVCLKADRDPECVMVTTPDIKQGTTRWTDLLNARVHCFNCFPPDRDPSCSKDDVAAIGFLCYAQSPDPDSGRMGNCPSRRLRRMQHTYDGSGLAELQATVNRLFGYAHAAGMEDHVGRTV